MILKEFLEGLSAVDVLRVYEDRVLYGNAFVKVENGRKVRVDPLKVEKAK